MLKTSWAYSLKREDLVKYLSQVGKDATGNVDELRKRFAKFLTTDHTEDEMKDLLELQSKHDAINNPAPLSPGSTLQIPVAATYIPPTSPVKMETPNKTGDTSEAAMILPIPLPSHNEPQRAPSESRIMVVELVRKWGLKFDGGRDPLGFIERAEELAKMYNIDLDQLPLVLPELFKEKALVWLRNNNRHWTKWSLFKKDFYRFFLPTRYFEKLEDEIRKRTQHAREPFKEYVLALQDLMRHADLSEAQKLERIFRNAQPDYQWYIRRKDFTTLDDLLQLADDLESIPTNTPQSRSAHHRMVIESPYSRNDVTRCNDFEVQGHKGTMNSTRLLYEDEKLKAIVLIGNNFVTTIIDTGATRSFITPQQIQRFSSQPVYVPVDIDVLLADGSKKLIKEAAKYMVTLGNISAECNFLIMEESTEDIILGIDFLRIFNTTLTCAGLEVNCGSRKPENNNMNLCNRSQELQIQKQISKTKMSAERRKFEKTSQKFKKNVEREKAKIRKTIFLDEDNIPSTSKGARSQYNSRKRRASFCKNREPKAKKITIEDS
ncbi:uncharacterized protein LOC135955515 [Calliphora vicina]|uniref:uncharacterized protein LOC135955515 n=1 Tax=Calliphora vicina TaxID=7373 RepID=UPI00325B3FBB